MSTEQTQVRPFGMRDKIGYMFGDFGNDFTFLLSSIILMKFYSDVMGVPVAIIGIMMMAARFVDAFTDVAMGQIVDRSRPGKRGKFLPWIRRMSGVVALASFLMYASWFAGMSLGFKIFWMFFTYILWGSLCYTSINIPYGSMASAITAEPAERAALSNWRTIGATLASTVIGVILPVLIYYEDAAGNHVLSGSRTMIAALACSIGAVICYFLCYTMCTERVRVEQKTEKFSLTGLLRSLITNKALVGIVLSSVCLLLSQFMLQTMTTYVFPNYFGNTKAQSLSSLAGTAVTLILAAFTVRLSGRFGRRELSIAGALWSAVVLIAAYFLQIKNAWTFVLIYSLAFVGMAIFSLVCWAMITDVIDDTEVRSEDRADGTIYAVYSFARKLGQAASSGLSGVLLTVIGYSAATAYEPKVVQGIYNITCLAPAAGFLLLAIILKFLYPLDKKTVEQNAKILAERRKAKK